MKNLLLFACQFKNGEFIVKDMNEVSNKNDIENFIANKKFQKKENSLYIFLLPFLNNYEVKHFYKNKSISNQESIDLFFNENIHHAVQIDFIK